MASLQAQALTGYTNCDRNRNDLCEFDVETGLRKQCVYRYVNDVSNPNDADYANALAADPDLVKGKETWTCYPQAEVSALMLKSAVKDELTTVTSTYRKIDLGPAYNEQPAAVTTIEDWYNQQLDIINKLRARHGALPLELDADLQAGAQAQAEKNR